ncbi:hypothetical protein [uncultured Dubosiella sp.]|uniref:hypothetical protein n=1 Tax=uncultured Dubosiella sp. TaxID=1937011 RepID=UPI00272F50B2|nr:hypothetical protein [uncultured Dubosiella sp.]
MEQPNPFDWLRFAEIMTQLVAAVFPAVIGICLNPDFLWRRKRNLEKFKLENIYAPIVFEYHKLFFILDSPMKVDDKTKCLNDFLDFLDEKTSEYPAYLPEDILLNVAKLKTVGLSIDPFQKTIDFIFMKYQKSRSNLHLDDQLHNLEMKVGKLTAYAYLFFKRSCLTSYFAVVFFAVFYLVRSVVNKPLSVSWYLLFIVLEILYYSGSIIIQAKFREKMRIFDKKYTEGLNLESQQDTTGNQNQQS